VKVRGFLTGSTTGFPEEAGVAEGETGSRLGNAPVG